MSKTFDALKPYLDRAMALKAAMALFQWDNETLAPKEAGRLTSKVIGILSGEYFGVVNQDKVKELAKACREDSGLTQAEKAQVRELSEELEKLGCIPREEYQEFARLASESARVWAKAKEKDDWLPEKICRIPG